MTKTDSPFFVASLSFRLDDPTSIAAFADLRRELVSKDDLLTETRLEALAAASQLQTLRETVAKLRQELKVRLKSETCRISRFRKAE